MFLYIYNYNVHVPPDRPVYPQPQLQHNNNHLDLSAQSTIPPPCREVRGKTQLHVSFFLNLAGKTGFTPPVLVYTFYSAT